MLHPLPRPLHRVAPCPIHVPTCRSSSHHVEVLPTPSFPTRRSWSLSTLASPQRSTSARDIMRSGVARPRVGFSGCTSCSLPSLDVASACCKHMFQVFYMYVASVSCECCKTRLGCCICCNGYTHMLQASVPNISDVSDGCCTCFVWMFHMFHTYVASFFYLGVAYVSHLCCKCFIRMLHMFSHICCKCFI